MRDREASACVGQARTHRSSARSPLPNRGLQHPAKHAAVVAELLQSGCIEWPDVGATAEVAEVHVAGSRGSRSTEQAVATLPRLGGTAAAAVDVGAAVGAEYCRWKRADVLKRQAEGAG